MKSSHSTLRLKQLGIDTYREPVIFMRKDCAVCSSEGFETRARVRVTLNGRNILATLNTVESNILELGEASLSQHAFQLLNAKEGDEIHLSHPKPLESLSYVRSKIYGNALKSDEIHHIIEDVAHGRYSDVYISAFISACADGRLNHNELIDLTHAMVSVGKKITWDNKMIVDKHCIGGLPGNRTTLIIVPIVAAFGLIMPKTSSRAITSPAGTADTMATLAPVNLDLTSMKRVVEKESGCIVWGGGSVSLSPADDILIRVERELNLDSEGQLVASVISKKIAAGSTHIVIDIPIGPTAKVRSRTIAEKLIVLFELVAKHFNITLSIQLTDGMQPVGRGIGPALEAYDVLAVLQNKSDAPDDLRDRALTLAGKILEFSPKVKSDTGKKIATDILTSGDAWKKFQAIANAQGGLRTPPVAQYTHTITAHYPGKITNINSRYLSRLAKLAGAPYDPAAGVYLHAPLECIVGKDQPLFTIHAQSPGALKYALSLIEELPDIIQVEALE